MALEMGEPGLFWQILEKVIGILVLMLLLLLLGFFLFRFIKMVNERFRQKKLFANGLSAENDRDIREKYEIKKEKRTKKPSGLS